jgi:hypothetical protein
MDEHDGLRILLARFDDVKASASASGDAALATLRLVVVAARSTVHDNLSGQRHRGRHDRVTDRICAGYVALRRP